MNNDDEHDNNNTNANESLVAFTRITRSLADHSHWEYVHIYNDNNSNNLSIINHNNIIHFRLL